jgi:hypothetical protein
MPNYPGAANSTAQNTNPPLPVALYPGDTTLVFNAEQPVAPQSSVAVALSQSPHEGVVPSVSVEGFFSGAPGVFEIDLQSADVDADAFYVSYANVINAVGGNNTFRGEFPNVKAKFVRARLVARANAVNLTLRITR